MEGDDNNNLLGLLHKLSSPNKNVKLKIKDELHRSYGDAESTLQLCMVLSNAQLSRQLRKSAASVLKDRLSERENWLQLEQRHQMDTQAELFAALLSLRVDDKQSLQSDIIRNVGYVMGQEESGNWNELIFHHIETQCTAADAKSHAFGALIFKLLAKTSPQMLQQNLGQAQHIFMQAMETAKGQGELATPAMDHLLAAWTLTIPLFHQEAELKKELVFTMPTILCIIKETAYNNRSTTDPRQKCRGFDVINRLNKHLPELVKPHLKHVMEELFALATDPDIANRHRVQAISSIRSCLHAMRGQIIRLGLMDKLLTTLYTLLAIEPALDGNGEELYLQQPQEEYSTLAEAVQTLLYIAGHTDTNRVAARSLRLMQPQMDEETQSPPSRLAVQLFLALMAKGFTDLLANEPLERFIGLVKRGFNDSDVMVQHGAHYALSIMAENLQPEITRLVPQVLPLFNRFLDQITPAQRLANCESETRSRMFCALDIYCESLRQEVLHQHLDALMQRLLMLVQPHSNSLYMRQLALSSIRCLAKISGLYFKPHFDAVMDIAMQLVQYAPNEGQLLLRTYAIQAINSLSVVDSDKFALQAPQLMSCCMEIMNQMSGAQIFSYELLGVLSGYVPHKIVEYLPAIMHDVLTSIEQTGLALKESGETGESGNNADTGDTGDTAESSQSQSEADTAEEAEDANDAYDDDQDGDDVDEVDDTPDEIEGVIGDSEGEEGIANDAEHAPPARSGSVCADIVVLEESEDGHGDQKVQSSESRSSNSNSTSNASDELLGGHEEALICLKAFAINLPLAMMQYMPSLLDLVGTAAEQLHEIDKWSAYETLTQLVLLQWQHGNKAVAKMHCIQKLPTMIFFIQSSKETVNVASMMHCIQQLLQHLKSKALEADGYADMVFNMLSRSLRRKLACQFDIGVETETDSFQDWSQALHTEHLVMEAAGNLLPVFGHALRKRTFAMYFQMISSRFVRSLRHGQIHGQVSQTRFFLYNMTARCMEPLGVLAEQYYEILCYSIVDCILDSKPRVRQFAIDLFHWLLPNAIEREHTETIIRGTALVFSESLTFEAPLSLAERESVCGILASMICADCRSVNLQEVVPRLLGQLPLRKNLKVYEQLVPALRIIHEEYTDLPGVHVSKIVETLLDFLRSTTSLDKPEATRAIAEELLQQMKTLYPTIYAAVSQPVELVFPEDLTKSQMGLETLPVETEPETMEETEPEALPELEPKDMLDTNTESLTEVKADMDMDGETEKTDPK